MLKLYFGQLAHPEDLAALARAQRAMHLERQEFLGAMLERLRARERPWQHAVGKLMRDAERAMADNWAEVERAAEAAADRDQRSSA
jgi:Virulence activator alpha C-term